MKICFKENLCIKIKLMFMTAVLCSLLSFCVSNKALSAPALLQPKEPIIIVIDPGHGGENQGTTENGFEEKSMTIKTAQAMYEELSLFDNVVVYMTRTDDTDLSLKERAEYAKKLGADFLFSIHYNASIHHEIYGAEVWVSMQAPYTAYGYQFGYIHQLFMQDKGIYLRGVKTKINDNGTDYYGILRESTARNIPAAIIEHCHVDEARDAIFCDDEEELIAFGKADAHAVAKYFGLKSTSLDIDYSDAQLSDLPPVGNDGTTPHVFVDQTPPDVCQIEELSRDLEGCSITLKVNAADYDTPLLYYRYSYDEGVTFSPWENYPGSNAMTGEYQDSFQLTLDIPENTSPKIIIRVANMYDLYTDSNVLVIPQTFGIKKETEVLEEPIKDEVVEAVATIDTIDEPEESKEKSFLPNGWFNRNQKNTEKPVSITTFIILCFFIVFICFLFVFTYQFVRKIQDKTHRSKRKRRK